MAEETYINIPEYWANTQVRPRGFTEICDMVETQGRITGIWELKQWDPRTGEVRKRVVNKNVVTDLGAINLLASAIANASNANPWNRIYINNCSGSSTLSSTLSTGTPITTGANLPVATLPAGVPLNYPAPANAAVTTLQINFGGASPQTISMNATTAAGATSLNVIGFTPSSNWASGTAIVPLPNIAENPVAGTSGLTPNSPSAGVLAANSGVISAGGFTYTPTTGAGSRSVVITFTFTTTGGFTAGSYTDAWLVNSASPTNSASGVFTGSYICHEVNVPIAA